MKIESGRGVAGAAGPRRAGAGQPAPGFAPALEGVQRTAAASPASAVASLDAIIALQGEEGPSQRRARQARRGRDALDALEDLEHALLGGRAPALLRARLEALRHGGEPTGEAGLDGVLHEIDIRVAVELAKLDRLQRRA